MKTLRLNLKGCYFDAIRDGTKLTEYRSFDKWWHRLSWQGPWGDILLLRGYPKADDESRMLRRKWNGFKVETITHPHFGPDPVSVCAIDVSQSMP